MSRGVRVVAQFHEKPKMDRFAHLVAVSPQRLAVGWPIAALSVPASSVMLVGQNGPQSQHGNALNLRTGGAEFIRRRIADPVLKGL